MNWRQALGDPVDLELSLRGAGSDYAVSMRLSQPGSEAEARVGLEDMPVRFDLTALEALARDPASYGKALAGSLFANPDVLAGFRQARAAAQSASAPLRMRLLIAPDVSKLHSLFWETLRDPEDPVATLLTGEGVLFSRFISSQDLTPVRPLPKGELKALAAIANPSDLGEYGLEAIAVKDELERARAGLGKIPLTPIIVNCTLNAILENLREGCDILYLVAHGIFAKAQPWVMLQTEEGKAARVPGEEFASSIREMQSKPRLIALVSCESAGKGTGQALQALGPRLAEAGVPAVIAMQGSLSMGTAARLMPVFFKELQRDGVIDRALSVARGTVKDRDDFWMPALFMRLKSGRLWADEMDPAKNVTIIGGDSYNVSNISNSHLNLGSTFISVPQGDAGKPRAAIQEKAGRLVEQLHEALKKASREHQETAGALASLAGELAEDLAKEKPNRARIRFLMEGMEQAGRGWPEAAEITRQIAGAVNRWLEGG